VTQRPIRLAIIVLGVILLFGGQLLIFRDPPNALHNGGLIPIVIGTILLFWMAGGVRPLIAEDEASAPVIPDAAYSEPFRIRGRWLGVAVALTGWISLRAVQYPQQAHLLEYLVGWFGVMIALVLMVIPKRGQPYAPDRLPLLRWEWGLLAVLALLAGLLRLTDLGTIPYIFDQDEAKFAQEGADLWWGSFKENPFGPGIDSHPRVYTSQIAVAIAFMGHTVAAARVPAAIASLLGILAMYLLGRELFGWRVGLVAALFSIPWVLHVFFAKQGLNQPYDPLFATLAFYFMFRGLRRHALIDYALSGIFLAHAQLYYLGGRLAPFVMVSYLVFQWIRDREKPTEQRVVDSQWKALLLIPLTGFIVMFPHNFHITYYNQPISTRADKNIFLGGQFQFMVEQGRDKLIPYLVDQVTKSFNAFYVTKDNSGWIGEGAPLMGPFGAPLMLLGVIASFLLLWRRPRWCIPIGWAFIVVLVTGVMGTFPPFYERYYPGVTAFALLVGMGAQVIGVAVGNVLGRPRAASLVIIGIGVFLLIAGTFFYYFDFVPAKKYVANEQNFLINRAATAAKEVIDQGRFPVIFARFGTEIFNADVMRYQIYSRGYWVIEDPFEKLKQETIDQRAYQLPVSFLIPKGRLEELPKIEAEYPGGRAIPVYLPEDPTRLVFYVYEANTPLKRPTP
jgi:hypothetical protein